MYIHGGTVGDAAGLIEGAPGEFVAGCARRFRELHGSPAGDAEQRSWAASWPPLLDALMGAGLGELWIGLEYSLQGNGKRVDALVLGAGQDGSLRAIVVELKQWSECRPIESEPDRVLAHGAVTTHPCVQAAGYVRYLRTWLRRADLNLVVGAVTVLHNAAPSVARTLRRSDAWAGEIPVLGHDDLEDPATVRDAFGGVRLTAPSNEQVKNFLATRHSPPISVFDEFERTLNGNPSMTLLDEQQDALLELQSRLRKALDQPERHVLIVTGGPGTGKTVIATRLAATIPRLAKRHGTACTTRYLTPSGTLRWQLSRAAGPGAVGLVRNTRDYLKAIPRERHVPIIDEAQRIKDLADVVPKLLNATRLSVIFLDERQIIHPEEGITADALEKLIRDHGADTTRIDLVHQFRCGGSQRYLRWIDNLLSEGPSPQPWTADDYDFATSANPDDLEAWVNAHNDLGTTARISAGFCWPWADRPAKSPLNLEVELKWEDPLTGEKHERYLPWNSKYVMRDAEENIIVPHSQAWATDPGGHEQVGCIYTTQGLEYPYSAVIMGPDLVRRNDQWEARPECSEDPAMSDVSPDRYRQLAFNIYRVLLTRGSRGCRLYSTDPDTQT
ncbi:DNA/RNA helicase domain-containing protein, partial [Amycolatopsis lurida]|uniref:DNA/RNA helicase domain-containing protein n=1 Tax=Amycolatopsis lurida TaxID=31959 RepID=UPI00365D7445